MKDSQRSGLTREQWSAMTFYEKFEQVVIFVLSVIIAAIIVASVWALMREVVNRLLLGAFDTLDYATFQVVFGMIFTVVIALEFKRSLLVATERSLGILQVRTIVLIALLAIARKFIILDLGETESSWTSARRNHPRLQHSRARRLRSALSTGWCAIRTDANSEATRRADQYLRQPPACSISCNQRCCSGSSGHSLLTRRSEAARGARIDNSAVIMARPRP